MGHCDDIDIDQRCGRDRSSQDISRRDIRRVYTPPQVYGPHHPRVHRSSDAMRALGFGAALLDEVCGDLDVSDAVVAAGQTAARE